MSQSDAGTAEARKTEQVPAWKRAEIDELAAFLERFDSVGIVGIAGIPSRQLQAMRADLHGQATIRVSRNSLMERALAAADEGLEDLTEHVAGQVAFVGTDDNPFALYRELEASKTPAPIGAGEVTPNDIVIPEGDTGVDPGPFVGDLQSVGAAARIMDGSIHVTEDSTVAEAGDEVSADLANVLSELGIEPKEVGLDLHAVFSEGVMFDPEELDIDVDEYRADVEAAAARARALSVGAAYPTAQTAGTLLAKGAGEAEALGLFAAVEDEELMPDLIARADAQLRALAAHLDDDALPEELRGAAVETPATEDDTGDEAADGDTESADTDEDAQDDEDAETDAADDDDDDGGDALGAMFG
ncbi:MAG: 50S ribosomal protein L10 [Haloferacaceae archaeon]